MPNQRPFFLSTFFSAFRQQPIQNQNKPSTGYAPSTTYPSTSPSRALSSVAAAASASQQASRSAASAGQSSQTRQPSQQASQQTSRSIPISVPASRRRGSNSSSEGFREAIGADRWYIGGRTAAGEEKYFKLGVVRRVKSNDGLSLDRLSL